MSHAEGFQMLQDDPAGTSFKDTVMPCDSAELAYFCIMR